MDNISACSLEDSELMAAHSTEEEDTEDLVLLVVGKDVGVSIYRRLSDGRRCSERSRQPYTGTYSV